MKVFLGMLLLLLLTGCGVKLSSTTYYTPSIHFDLEENDGWLISQHEKGVWFPRSRLANGQHLFSSDDMWLIDNASTIDSFIASYKNDNMNISVYVVFKSAFGTRKFSGRDILHNVVSTDYYTPSWCSSINKQRIIVSFSPVDVDFDSSSVAMQKNKTILHGEEIASYQRGIISGAESFPPQTYNLSLIGDIKRLQPILVGSDAKSFNHPTFTYRFNMTCADLENSTFIIDGLYYKGKQIPPLRVRLNYYDFSKVPQYEGEPSAKDGNEVARP